MDIKDKIPAKDKILLATWAMESTVLQSLADQRGQMMELKCKEILEALGYSVKRFQLVYNPNDDIWEAQLRPEVLAAPTEEQVKSLKGRNN